MEADFLPSSSKLYAYYAFAKDTTKDYGNLICIYDLKALDVTRPSYWINCADEEIKKSILESV